jgi:hypothetical protein
MNLLNDAGVAIKRPVLIKQAKEQEAEFKPDL